MADRDSPVEHFNCATCTRPETHCEVCPIVDQPVALDLASSLLKLDARMERTGALPSAGGLLDQDQKLMRRLDTVARIRRNYGREVNSDRD